MKTFRFFHVFLAATLFCGASFAAEPAPIPKQFSALIGGFFGPTYVIELRDGTLHYTEHKRSTGPGPKPTASATITPTAEQWREFRESLDQLNVWRWRPDYNNDAIADGTQWRLEIKYADHALKTEGSNDYPDATGAPKAKSDIATTKTFDRYLAAVEKLLGGKTFK